MPRGCWVVTEFHDIFRRVSFLLFHWQLCLLVGLNLPRCAGFDDRIGDYDQPSCDCDDDQFVQLSALFQTF